jgi:hypothetical protein
LTVQPPAPRPCDACPYRRDTPGGIWHPDEYLLLPLYDKPTAQQPTGVFMCHLNNGKVCAGWAGCHGPQTEGHDLFAVRVGIARGQLTVELARAIVTYVSPVLLHPSGFHTALHGLRGVVDPSPATLAAVRKLERRHALRR